MSDLAVTVNNTWYVIQENYPVNVHKMPISISRFNQTLKRNNKLISEVCFQYVFLNKNYEISVHHDIRSMLMTELNLSLVPEGFCVDYYFDDNITSGINAIIDEILNSYDNTLSYIRYTYDLGETFYNDVFEILKTLKDFKV